MLICSLRCCGILQKIPTFLLYAFSLPILDLGKLKKLIEERQQRTIKAMNPDYRTEDNKVKNQMLEEKLENMKNNQAISVNTSNGNRFIRSDKTKNQVSPDGLRACTFKWLDIIAEKGFFISGKICRPLLYYFEVKRTSSSKDCGFRVGLSTGSISTKDYLGETPNSYAIQYDHDSCLLSETRHWFEWPTGAIKPEWSDRGDVVGCGILLNSKNELSIFFTLNGILLGRQIPIIPPAGAEHLYPTVSFRNSSLEANFGDDLSNPFKYDTKKCPGLILE